MTTLFLICALSTSRFTPSTNLLIFVNGEPELTNGVFVWTPAEFPDSGCYSNHMTGARAYPDDMDNTWIVETNVSKIEWAVLYTSKSLVGNWLKSNGDMNPYSAFGMYLDSGSLENVGYTNDFTCVYTNTFPDLEDLHRRTVQLEVCLWCQLITNCILLATIITVAVVRLKRRRK